MPKDDGFEGARCRLCGCTEIDPCDDGEYGPCGWYAPELCTACVRNLPDFIRECHQLALWLEDALPIAHGMIDRLRMEKPDQYSARAVGKRVGLPPRSMGQQFFSRDWQLLARIAKAMEDIDLEDLTHV